MYMYPSTRVPEYLRDTVGTQTTDDDRQEACSFLREGAPWGRETPPRGEFSGPHPEKSKGAGKGAGKGTKGPRPLP